MNADFAGQLSGEIVFRIDHRSPGWLAIGVPVSAQRYCTVGPWNTALTALDWAASAAFTRCASSITHSLNGISFSSFLCISQDAILRSGSPASGSHSAQRLRRVEPN